MPRLNKIKSNISVAGKEGAMKTRSKTDFFIFMWGQSPCVDFWGGGKSHSCLGFTSLSLVINIDSIDCMDPVNIYAGHISKIVELKQHSTHRTSQLMIHHHYTLPYVVYTLNVT